jgi:hypothetical protein
MRVDHWRTLAAIFALPFCLGALDGPASAQAAFPAPTSATITLQPGESVRAALQRVRRQQQLAGLLSAMTAVSKSAPAAAEAANGSTLPAIVSGQITSGALNVIVPPAAPVLQLNYRAPGVYAMLLEFTSPHGQVLTSSYVGQTLHGAQGTITFQDFANTLGLYAEPGIWTLTSATISATINHSTVNTNYDQSQLAAIFTNPTMTVVNNGTPDFTPPVVSAGKILTPLVHLTGPHPSVDISLTVQDVAGVNQAYVVFAPTQTTLQETTNAVLPVPMVNGPVPLEYKFSLSSLEGPYRVVGYAAFDLAGNYVVDDTPADLNAAFGTTTFWVTN